MASNGEQALIHILDNVMKLKENDSLRDCLRYDEIESLEDLLALSPEDISELKWKQEDGTITPIRKHNKGKLISLQRLSQF